MTIIMIMVILYIKCRLQRVNCTVLIQDFREAALKGRLECFRGAGKFSQGVTPIGEHILFLAKGIDLCVSQVNYSVPSVQWGMLSESVSNAMKLDTMAPTCNTLEGEHLLSVK